MHKEITQESRRELAQVVPPRAVERSGVHFSELPEAKAGEPLWQEWNTYRREVGSLLANGHEARFALLKDEKILGLFDTWEAARKDGLRRFFLEPFLVQQIRVEEPYSPNSRRQHPMSQLTFPVTPAGLEAPASIGLDGKTLAALSAAECLPSAVSPKRFFDSSRAAVLD